MEQRTIREDAYARIEVDRSRELVILTWRGYVPSPDYRAILLQLLDVVKAEGLRFWLSDSSKMGVILRSDEKWSVETLTPMLIQLGMRRVAVVRSIDFFSQTASERMVERTAGRVPYKVEFFNDRSEAEAWLAREAEVLV